MDTSPSGQDNAQIEEFRAQGSDYFIRGIFNKRKKAQFDIFLFSLGFTCTDVEWSVEDESDESRREFWKEQIADKVQPIVFPAIQHPYPYNHPYRGLSVIDDDQAVLDLSNQQLDADLEPLPGETKEQHIRRIIGYNPQDMT
jgi:hypothetical protein